MNFVEKNFYEIRKFIYLLYGLIFVKIKFEFIFGRRKFSGGVCS